MSVAIPVKYVDTTKYKVRIMADDYSESPEEWGNYKLVQFRDRDWSSYRLLEESEYVTNNCKLTPAVLAMLKSGRAFTIDYRRYSNSDGGYYRLDGSIPRGEVESQDVNGLIIFDPAYIKGASFEQRRQYAIGDLEEYTNWANGEVYYVEVTTESGLEVEATGGFIGTEAVKQYLIELLGDAEYEAIGVHRGHQEAESTYEVAL